MAEEDKTTEAEIKEEIEKKVEEKKEETRPSDAELKKTEHHAEKKEEKAWKEFIVPLRRKFGKVARYRRTPKAIRAIKEFLVRHMKMYERDLKKVKLDKYLNEFIWTRGIRNPPSRVRIKAIVDGDVIRAELAELTEALKFRKEKLILLEVFPLKRKEDISGAKLLKAFEFLKKELGKNDFGIIESNWHWDKKAAYFYFAFENRLLPETKEIAGPPVRIKFHYDKFMKKHKKTMVRGNRVFAIAKRNFRDSEKLIRVLISGNYLKNYVKKIKIA